MQKLISLLVSVLALIELSSWADARRVDCTKFVFAPRCRGVAAKRARNSFDVSDPNVYTERNSFEDGGVPDEASGTDGNIADWDDPNGWLPSLPGDPSAAVRLPTPAAYRSLYEMLLQYISRIRNDMDNIPHQKKVDLHEILNRLRKYTLRREQGLKGNKGL